MDLKCSRKDLHYKILNTNVYFGTLSETTKNRPVKRYFLIAAIFLKLIGKQELISTFKTTDHKVIYLKKSDLDAWCAAQKTAANCDFASEELNLLKPKELIELVIGYAKEGKQKLKKIHSQILKIEKQVKTLEAESAFKIKILKPHAETVSSEIDQISNTLQTRKKILARKMKEFVDLKKNEPSYLRKLFAKYTARNAKTNEQLDKILTTKKFIEVQTIEMKREELEYQTKQEEFKKIFTCLDPVEGEIAKKLKEIQLLQCKTIETKNELLPPDKKIDVSWLKSQYRLFRN